MDQIHFQIKQLRNRLDLTQNDLSQAFGFSNSKTIEDIESGLLIPNKTVILMTGLLMSISVAEAKDLVERLIQQNRNA